MTAILPATPVEASPVLGRWLQIDTFDGVEGEDSIWICNCTVDDGTVGTELGTSEQCADCGALRPPLLVAQ